MSYPSGPGPGSGSTVTVNVGALSNALAVAIQQATDGRATAVNNTGRGSASALQSGNSVSLPGPSTSTMGENPATTASRSAAVVLPSYLKRKKQEEAASSRSKRPKSVQVWDRDIVCLPKSESSYVSYPRGKARSKLGENGLIGKIRLTSVMTEEEVEQEVRSVFRQPMNGRADFPFMFLQATGAGTKTLTVPAVSSTFRWTAQQVAKLGGHKQAIYILAMEDLVFKDVQDDSSSEHEDDISCQRFESDTFDGERGLEQDSNMGMKQEDGAKAGCSSSGNECYRAYVNLIDLTVSNSDDENEEEFPSVSISLNSASQQTLDGINHDPIVAKHVIQQHQYKVITGVDEEDRQRIHLRRSHLITDALHAFSKSQFNVSKMLKVVFIGEPSVDEGGPRREFFQLAMREAFTTSGLFIGWPENVIPIHNVEAVAHNKYHVVGKLIATCLVQGGQPPACFATAIADYLVYNEIRCKPCLDDIPDYDVQQKLEKVKVKSVTSTEELRKVVDKELDFRFECGFQKPTCQLEYSDREHLIKALWLHHVFFLPHAELEQLRKGLCDTLQLDALMCTYPHEMHSFLVASSAFNVTPDYLVDAFMIHYSDQGSNKRTAEEAIIINWTEYIMETTERTDVTPADILHFLSGSTKLPASGFPVTPSIHFTDEVILPRSSTCDVSITFPRSYGLKTYNQFKEIIDLCILNSFGFGDP